MGDPLMDDLGNYLRTFPCYLLFSLRKCTKQHTPFAILFALYSLSLLLLRAILSFIVSFFLSFLSPTAAVKMDEEPSAL